MLTHPKVTAANQGIKQWFGDLLDRGLLSAIPEIVDYELRRELLRAEMARTLHKLDLLKMTLYYDPITTPIMQQAAFMWAVIRQKHQPTASKEALDCDVILAAHAHLMSTRGLEPIIITHNVDHIRRLTDHAYHWYEVQPPPR